MKIKRRASKQINVGKVPLGNFNPIRVQTLCTTKTTDVKATVNQILELEKIGLEIVRVIVDNEEEANTISQIKKEINIPLVADVLYNDEVILKAIRRGADKIRINPGKLELRNLKRVIYEAKSFNIPVRIGINMGSLPNNILDKYGQTPEAMVEAAFQAINEFEKEGFDDIVVSLKASDVLQTIEANMKFAEKTTYPMHIALTQAGSSFGGLVRASVGIGHLLLNGIGDTIRITLAGNPKREVLAGHYLLRSLGLREGPVVIAGYSPRSSIPVNEIAQRIEEELVNITSPIKVVILASLVEKGEMRTADLGIAADGDIGVIFKKGEEIKRVKKDEILDTLLAELGELIPSNQ
ncbi:flavodoxin-dependent (E)-4-hydroxy-3-methylbut-2-enyl-diphosphate synthase [Candidatus Roizmanbacteria bacterium]|nr:flavodoxin-dependent (E)-4-hydroxy-3-methylbut-2-enyl-diphosphate synthase [Candidatus Roizmanbacteria bacterium]